MNEESLFVAALEMPSAERQAFLDGVCGDDWKLRDRIERLLVASDRTRGILEQSPIAGSGWSTADHQLSGPDHGPGATIDHYKLIEPIGEGGMGTVWMARQTEPVKRLVALKLIKAGMDSKQVIARFEAERQALALMEHPNIARVYDAGTTKEESGGVSSGRPYFVMELVKGVPITRYCDDHHLTPQRRLELFIPVCLAVQHAHHKGIIHRDLKPSNILVAQYDGKPIPKVIDFGVAKAAGQSLTEKTLVTGIGSIVGTIEYMSPEQAEIDQLDIDTRSDIYSLGVLLYELLVGSPPFRTKDLERGGMLEMLRIIREQEPSKPSTKLSTADGLPALAASRGTEPAKLTRLVRGELDWIVMKALEKDRRRRYETANGFAMDIQRYLADEPVLACPPSAAYRFKKLVRRHRGPVLAAVLLFLALIGGIIGTTWGMLLATDQANQKKTALDAAEASERDAKEQLREALRSQARASRFSRRPGQRLESLEALSKAAKLGPDDSLRDEAIAAMGLPDVRHVPGWRSSPLGAGAVAYSSTYKMYARVDQPGLISVRSIPDDRETIRIQTGIILGSYLYFSPDNRHLLALEEGYVLRVWRLDNGQRVPLPELGVCRAHTFSPDGKQLIVGQMDLLLLIDLASGKELKRWQVATQAHTLAFHPYRQEVAVGYLKNQSVSVYDVASGARLAQLPVGTLSNHVVAWHPHGDRLAVTGSDPRIQIWDVPAKRKVATLEGHVQFVPTLTFHPDGQLLATRGWDGMLLLWDPFSGRLLTRLASVGTPQFSVDGRWLGVAWHGDRADLLEVTPSREYRTLVHSAGSGGYADGDISPDGRLLVMGMDDGARLWDLHSGRQIAVLPERTSFVFFENTTPAEPDSTNSPGYRLLTSGADGLQRWAVTWEEPAKKSLRIGPRQQISTLSRAFFGRSRDGRTLAVATKEGIANHILDLESGQIRRRLPGHLDGDVRSLSGDGQWAASCGWQSDCVRLWNISSGEVVNEWNLGKRSFTYFTPDSRTLIISRDDELSFWDVSTFQPIRRLPRDVAQFPSHVAFSPDGRLMAMEMAPATIHLKEVATGRTVAQFEDPHGDRAGWTGFTPDGTQLIVAAKQTQVIRIWDLRAIRARLKTMQLDWDWPEFEPESDARPVDVAGPPALKATVDTELRVAWNIWRDQGQESLKGRRWLVAVGQFTNAIKLKPDEASCWYGRGSAYSALSLPKDALADFVKATELEPTQWSYWSSRAATKGQLVRWREAVDDYSMAIKLSPSDGSLFQARGIAHGRLNQWQEALADHDKSTQLNPKDATCWRRRGDANARLGQSEKAIGDYSKSIDLAPNEANHWGYRATVYGRIGQWEKALTDYSKAAQLRPAEMEYRCSMGFAHAQLGQWEKAIVPIKEATRSAGTYLPAWYYLALLELRRGHVDVYSEMCSQLIARFEKRFNNEEANWIAKTCALAPIAADDWTRSLKFAENAYAAEPKSGDRINHLGAALFRVGRFKEAAERFAEAHKALKENPGSHVSIIYNLLFLAMSHQRLDNSAEAAKWLEKAAYEMSQPAAATANDWSQSLLLQLLRSEAETLLAKKGR
jgi:serine/threonine protein kinase/WD40 repeat protein/tetratricopeptide (TPR) repeat protein